MSPTNVTILVAEKEEWSEISGINFFRFKAMEEIEISSLHKLKACKQVNLEGGKKSQLKL